MPGSSEEQPRAELPAHSKDTAVSMGQDQS